MLFYKYSFNLSIFGVEGIVVPLAICQPVCLSARATPVITIPYKIYRILFIINPSKQSPLAGAAFDLSQSNV